MNEELAVKFEAVMDVAAVCGQVNLIQQVMSAVMKKGTHYDVIPGCGDKPTLLKPGAEKLAMTFRLDLQTETEIVELGNGHREYRSKTTVYHIKTGERLASGMGSCSTMETKYRYRSENTGQLVPKEYWDTRDQGILGGLSFFARKIEGQWMIVQQVEHPNPADFYNTCLKMSEKRSKVAAIFNATAASDLFTQDIEDMDFDKSATSEVKKPTNGKPAVNQPQPKQSSEVQTVITDVVKITTKAGVNPKTKQPYTLYSIYGEGNTIYTTFDEAFATFAKTAKETMMKVSIKYKVDQYGNKIESLDIIEPDLTMKDGDWFNFFNERGSYDKREGL